MFTRKTYSSKKQADFQDNPDILEHQKLIGSGRYSHAEIDKYLERLIALSTRYVNIDPVTVLNLSGQGDVGYTDLDLSGHTTPNTFSVRIRIAFLDSASSTTNTNASIRENGKTGSQDMSIVSKGYHRNSISQHITGFCECDTDQIIEYNIAASGGATAALKIILYGYTEYIYIKNK